MTPYFQLWVNSRADYVLFSLGMASDLGEGKNLNSNLLYSNLKLTLRSILPGAGGLGKYTQQVLECIHLYTYSS